MNNRKGKVMEKCRKSKKMIFDKSIFYDECWIPLKMLRFFLKFKKVLQVFFK